MRAETHLEVYRPFQGELRERGARFVPILSNGLRLALRRRWPRFVLFLPVLIATVVLCFLTYARFKFAVSGDESPSSLEERMAYMAIARAQQMFNVVTLILGYNAVLANFGFLVMAWYGAGLLCDDAKAGAHQLYFARPITRLDYVLGKFLIVGTFGVGAVLLPPLILCVVATFCSPEWSFLRNEWDVFLRSLGYGLFWTLTVSTLVLAISSLTRRRSFAQIAFFGLLFLSAAVGEFLGELLDSRLRVLSIPKDLITIGFSAYGRPFPEDGPEPRHAWLALSVLVLLGFVVLWRRLRRLEVVA